MRDKTTPPLSGDAKPPRPSATPPREGNAQAKSSPPAEGRWLAAGKGQAQPDGVVPKLRFPEFRATDAWAQKSLNDVLDLVVREKKKPQKPYLGLGVRSHGKGTFRKPEEIPEKNAMEFLYEVKNNDLVVSITFAWEGAIAIAQPDDSGALVSHRFPTYVFKENILIPDFFKYVILDKRFVYKLGVISPGGAGRNRVMNKNDFLLLKTYLPSLPEQQRIADCLTSFDKVISAENQKLDALKVHKKGLMQGLFPDHPAPAGHPSAGGEGLGSEFPSAGGVAEGRGGLVPRLRFPEFRDSGDWAEKTLQDICQSISSGRDKSQPEGSYDLFGSTGIIGKTLNNSYSGRFILVARVGANAGLLTIANGTFGVTDNTLVISLEKFVNLDFIFFSLVRFDLNRLIFGSGQPLITGGQLKGLTIATPPNDAEQQRIAACLTSLDDLIAAQAEKIAALKDQKKGLLQGLFPVSDV